MEVNLTEDVRTFIEKQGGVAAIDFVPPIG
jgi:hypothetical protein